MKTKKPKRIRAERQYVDDVGYVSPFRDTSQMRPCYILRQSDIRALAEQLLADFALAPYDAGALGAMAHALRRAGMTPGKEAK